MAEAYGIKAAAIPTTFIGDSEPIVGSLSDEVTGKEIEERVRHCVEHLCPDPLPISERPAKKKRYSKKKVRLSLFLYLALSIPQKPLCPF